MACVDPNRKVHFQQSDSKTNMLGNKLTLSLFVNTFLCQIVCTRCKIDRGISNDEQLRIWQHYSDWSQHV